ncbi:MAG: hypothetical protein ACLGI5_04115 [Thermoleophilia bacterium]
MDKHKRRAGRPAASDDLAEQLSGLRPDEARRDAVRGLKPD